MAKYSDKILTCIKEKVNSIGAMGKFFFRSTLMIPGFDRILTVFEMFITTFFFSVSGEFSC